MEMKAYTTKAAAKAAIKKAGLDNMTVDYDFRRMLNGQGKISPCVICHDAEDKNYVNETKGFRAIIMPSRAAGDA